MSTRCAYRIPGRAARAQIDRSERALSIAGLSGERIGMLLSRLKRSRFHDGDRQYNLWATDEKLTLLPQMHYKQAQARCLFNVPSSNVFVL